MSPSTDESSVPPAKQPALLARLRALARVESGPLITVVLGALYLIAILASGHVPPH